MNNTVYIIRNDIFNEYAPNATIKPLGEVLVNKGSIKPHDLLLRADIVVSNEKVVKNRGNYVCVFYPTERKDDRAELDKAKQIIQKLINTAAAYEGDLDARAYFSVDTLNEALEFVK